MKSTAFNGEVSTNVYPELMRVLCEENSRMVDGKAGKDSFSQRAEALMKTQFAAPVFTVETINGTAANMLALKCMLHPWGSILCAEETHINTFECGATEFNLRAKMFSVPTGDGKLTKDHVLGMLEKCRHYGYLPSVLVITQPTEYGVLYSMEELSELVKIAHEQNMYVYVDGARITYALAALNTDFHAMIEQTDVDAFTFGGTKCGAMFGEMVVFRRSEFSEHLAYMQKQSMQHFDKSKFLGLQLLYLLESERWRSIAGRAITLAKYLEQKLSEKGILSLFPVDTNMVFCHLDANQMECAAAEFDLHYWSSRERIVRLCISHETAKEQINQLVSLL